MHPNKDSKVFGIGLSKTGTTSLFVALHHLGYRSASYRHMQRLGLSDWFRGDFARDFLEEYDAVTDNPISAFYPQLDERYPGSKFILTRRDKKDWLTSTRKQWSKLDSVPKWKKNLVAARRKKGWLVPLPSRRKKYVAVRDFTARVRLVQFGMTGWSESRFAHVYDAHERTASQYFRDRPDDLLVMNIFEGDGWEHLCRFLGKPIPDVPFPNVKPGHRLPQ